MTGDKVEKEDMVFAHLTDFQMAVKVRMLMRDELSHEAICCGARDRIMYLSQEVARLTEALNAGVPILEQAATRIEKQEHLLKDSMQFFLRRDMDGDPLNIHLAREINALLAESV